MTRLEKTRRFRPASASCRMMVKRRWPMASAMASCRRRKKASGWSGTASASAAMRSAGRGSSLVMGHGITQPPPRASPANPAGKPPLQCSPLGAARSGGARRPADAAHGIGALLHELHGEDLTRCVLERECRHSRADRRGEAVHYSGQEAGREGRHGGDASAPRGIPAGRALHRAIAHSARRLPSAARTAPGGPAAAMHPCRTRTT